MTLQNTLSSCPFPGLHSSPRVAELLLYSSMGKAHRLRMATLELEALAQGANTASIPLALDLLLGAFDCDPADPSTAAQALRVGLKLGLAPELIPELEAAATGGTTPLLTHWQDGLAAWRDGHTAQAVQHFSHCGNTFTAPMEGLGHCLAALGQEDAAITLWRKVLRRRPWHTQLYLTLHDYMQGYHKPLPPSSPLPVPSSSSQQGQAAALFYSWNKADDLNAALASLADGGGSLPPGVALVACLNNGSTDATAEVMHRWQERWGQRFLSVHLPVNVGAAAARNWLASLPEVRALPYAIYIDDDALLPTHWLGHLGRAMQVYPDAGVWGCRIADAHDPQHLQCGPLHLQPLFCLDADAGGPLPGEPDAQGKDTHPDVAFSPLLAEGQPFRLSYHLCAGLDHGAYNFLRPCASVAGCCHLFRTQDLVQQGFCLNFSPSQHDDAHRDLLMLQQGRMACYTGFCTVRHSKRTGAGTGTSVGKEQRQSLSGAAYGNAVGNRYKLHGAFDVADIVAGVRHEYAELDRDFHQRAVWLEQSGGLW